MTDRVKGLTVILDKDIREDDIQILVNAISMFRYVLSVKPVLATSDDMFVRARCDGEWRNKIIQLIKAT